MKLKKVVPFGRSFDEYQNMFNLTDLDLKKRILGVGDGPASFNAEATKRGSRVISIDPIYQFSGEEILHRFNQVLDNIIDQVKATPEDWVWSYHQSPDELRQNRITVIHRFIEDYANGIREERYQIGELPTLSIKTDTFDLALCSHLLFLYSDQFDLSFHQRAIEEMLRVSQEVRIFPLLTLMRQPSPHLDPILDYCQQKGHAVSIETVPYELQKGGNQMLRVQKRSYSGEP